MLGSIDGWFYRTLAGIQTDEEHPGFEHFFVRPFVPDTLTFVNATIQTIRGPVAVKWTDTHGTFELSVAVPANSTATIYVPAAAGKSIRTAPSLSSSRLDQGEAVYEVGSGAYYFKVPAKRSR
jgi:hypothetical protein